jgi:hypothetical protein
MSGNWILSPLTQYGMLAAGLIACLDLFVSVKREIHALKRRMAEETSALEIRLRAAEESIEQGRETRADAGEQRLVRLSSLNLTRRTQAIRMHRRGEAVATIAATTGAPRNEIELLIKLHGAQQQRAS